MIEAAGRHGNSVSDEALAEATATLLEEKDKEAVMVYALHVACWHAGKGGTMRGREAAASVLKSLPEEVVSQRVVQLHQASPSYVQPEIEWLMGYLKIPLPNT